MEEDKQTAPAIPPFNEVKEGVRSYKYPNGEVWTFTNVTAVAVRSSGYHMLELEGGKSKCIVKPGWSVIELQDAEWSF